MRLADMRPDTPVSISEELAQKCNEVVELAQHFVDLASHEYTLGQVLLAMGVLVGQQADSIETLQQFFLTMENGAVAAFAMKRMTRVNPN